MKKEKYVIYSEYCSGYLATGRTYMFNGEPYVPYIEVRSAMTEYEFNHIRVFKSLNAAQNALKRAQSTVNFEDAVLEPYEKNVGKFEDKYFKGE